MARHLVLIAGNTNCRVALYSGDALRAARTRPLARVLESPARLLARLEADDAALASVVPRATRPLARALGALTGRPPFIVSARCRTGLHVRYDRRRLGADRLCAAEGAHARWPGDLAVADFGTAVTINFVSRTGVFEGGPILPGPHLILAALAAGTARLPRARLRAAAGPLPRTTGAALVAGALAAVAGGVEHALGRVERRTGRRWRLVGTGGAARLIARHLPRLRTIDPLLAARGLLELLRRNRPD